MNIRIKAELPEDMSAREREALLLALLGEMTTPKIRRFIQDNFGVDILADLEKAGDKQ